LNHELVDRRAVFLDVVETAPDYAMFAMENPMRPGLVNVGHNAGVCIEAELWSLAPDAFGSLVAASKSPAALGTIRLKDEREVKAFLSEEYAIRSARPISAYGGWRAYLAALAEGRA